MSMLPVVGVWETAITRLATQLNLSELALDTPTDDWTALKIEDGDINGLNSRFLLNAF
jgi:hypothetical protein